MTFLRMKSDDVLSREKVALHMVSGRVLSFQNIIEDNF